jgi:phosphotriesterase-related protein
MQKTAADTAFDNPRINMEIMTVTGPIHPSHMGATLSHEHLLVDFIGAGETGYHRWNREEVAAKVLPFLEEAKNLGVHTLVDCTPRFIGRDPRLLQELSIQSGLNILTNTGLYAAVNEKFIPDSMKTGKAMEFASQWIEEANRGIEDTGIRPGFIKIGVNGKSPLSELERELVKAAAYTHRATGLTIVSHTGPAPAAMDQLDLLASCGVSPTAFVWTHAQASNTGDHVIAARKGAWISLDSVGSAPGVLEHYTTMLTVMLHEGLLEKVLLSHDAGWFQPGEPGGGTFRGFSPLTKDLVPRLRENGFSEKNLVTLLEHNPRSAFTKRLRLASAIAIAG